MTQNIFSRIGYYFSKPEVVSSVPDEITQELNKINAQRKALYGKDTVEAAEMYDQMLPTAIIEELMFYHNYMCLQWGSRKVARLTNICRNILDVEIYTEDSAIEEEHREHAFGLLVWMCWLTPIPIKAYLTRPDADEFYKKEFAVLLTEKNKVVDEKELKIILAGVFEGVNSQKGNPILDIFHDALRFEEAQFGLELDDSVMRTTLGQNGVFKIKAQKDSRSNLTPHWMFALQELKSLTGLVDKIRSIKDEEYAEQDGINS